MQFWQSGVAVSGLLLGALLLAAELLRRGVRPLGALGIPASIIGGVVGLLLGPSVAGVIPLDQSVLESVVYHGLAVVFIAIGLQSPPVGRQSGGAASMAFAIPFLAVLQGLLGLGAVLLLGIAAGEHMHPGFGLMLPLGFSQGPGQALALGSAWETGGMTSGAQVGLIIAAFGFAWAIVVGVPLVAWGRRRGLNVTPRDAGARVVIQQESRAALPAGALELLTRQVVAIAVIYLAAYAAVYGLSKALAGRPQLAAMVWGFHFIVAMFIALAVRRVVISLPIDNPLDTPLLGRIAGLTVDLVTCAALAAVQIAVLTANWLPITVVVVLGGTVTLLAVLWLAPRAFPEEPFEHAVVLFGMGTGTLPTGLALFRILDPEMKGGAPASAVLGSAGAIVLGVPLLLVVLPMPAAGWPDDYPSAGWTALGILVVYLLALFGAWWKFGKLTLEEGRGW